MNCYRPKTTDFFAGQKVAYVPFHTRGDLNHPDVERGTVTSVNENFVFVQFEKNRAACEPFDLVKVYR